MRKLLIASCLAVTTLGGALLGGGMVARAAETTALVATGETPGAWQLFISGQIGRLLTLRSELNLSGDQRQQIRQIFQAHRVELAGVIRPVVENRRELRDAVAADAPDEKAIRAAAANLTTSIGDAALVAAKVRGEVWQVLTPDQRQKIDTFRKENAQSVDKVLDRMSAAS